MPLNLLIIKIAELEALWEKYADCTIGYEEEKKRQLPVNFFYNIVRRNIEADLELLYAQLRQVNPAELEAIAA